MAFVVEAPLHTVRYAPSTAAQSPQTYTFKQVPSDFAKDRVLSIGKTAAAALGFEVAPGTAVAIKIGTSEARTAKFGHDTKIRLAKASEPVAPGTLPALLGVADADALRRCELLLTYDGNVLSVAAVNKEGGAASAEAAAAAPAVPATRARSAAQQAAGGSTAGPGAFSQIIDLVQRHSISAPSSQQQGE